MERFRFLISGSGGQGVVSLAILLAECAVLFEGLEAVQSQSYGPEARGGATRSDVIIADSEIYFPKVNQPNALVALTEEAASKYLPLIRPGGMCLYDTDLVTPSKRIDATQYGLPMFRTTKEVLGKTQAFNICVLGALASLTAVVRLESLEKVLKARFASAHHKANQTALHLGAELAQGLV